MDIKNPGVLKGLIYNAYFNPRESSFDPDVSQRQADSLAQMSVKNSAILLLGFQQAYFSKQGMLYPAISAVLDESPVLANALQLIEALKYSTIEMVSTPMVLGDDGIAASPVWGLLPELSALHTFERDASDVEMLDEIKAYEDRIVTLNGRSGMDAFQNTDMEYYLRSRGIENLILLGGVAPLGIESTGRAAYEKGFNVIMVSDCIAARTPFEHKFYMESVFPLYAAVMDGATLLNHLR